MPIEETTTLTIACSNPVCPGHELDSADRAGWLLVNTELYGEPSPPQRAFCTFDCFASFTDRVAKGKAEWALPTPEVARPAPLVMEVPA